jgi:D-3-phosphoglycerate dehydrogenase
MQVLHIEPRRYNEQVRKLLEAHASVDYADVETKEALIEAIRQKPYEVLFVKLGIPIDAEVLAAASKLRFIVTPTTGLNHIDQDEADNRNVQVISLKGETEFLKKIQSTSEHTWMLLLALIRKLPAALEDVKGGKWRREPFLGMELNEKTLGIIGFGRLGKIVAGYGKAFHMRVLAYDVDEYQLSGVPYGIEESTLSSLLEHSDVISLHIPASKENYHFIDREKIGRMKAGAVLINTSRGEVVDGDALLQALESGQLRGAAIDVIEGDSSWEQGVPAKHALIEYARTHDNLLITPHIGGYALESIDRTRLFITQKFLKESKII